MFETGAALRQACRNQSFDSQTSGQATGYIQANLAILPRDWAFDFLIFAQRNPKPCPVLEVGDPGDPFTRFLAKQADIRSDLPRYRVYRHGQMESDPLDITELWQDDLVFFLIGCSFTFEQALLQAHIDVRHISQQANVPMYKSNIVCHGAGKFPDSPMVVSMRPFKPADAIKAIEITRDYPGVHGSPVHIGDPQDIGISDIDHPDWGDRVTIKNGEIPVFWACGVTPQMAAMVAKPPLMITHAPGHMFVGDNSDTDFRL